MSIDYAVLGQRIKQARLAKKMTQETLSEKLDVSVAFLSRVERGTSHINLLRLTQISNILGVSEGELLSGTANISNNYMNREFAQLIKRCPKEKQKLVYNVIKTIIDTDIGK